MAQQTAIFTSSFFRLEQVTDGVYAAIVVDGAGALGNAGFVDLGDEVLVFDTFLTPQAGLDLQKAVEQVIGKPVRYVVNSHYHADHCMGNQVFAGATILATERTRELIIERNAIKDLEKEQQEFGEYLQKAEAEALAEPNDQKRQSMLLDISDKKVLLESMPMVRLTPPTVTFADRLEIHGSKRSVELISYGGGHSDSDAFLYLPEDNLAFMADLVLVGATPFMGVGHPEEWLTILSRVKELGLQTIIPGHGQVGAKEHIDLTEQYIRFVLDRIKTSKEQGLTVEETVQLEIPAPYCDWDASMVYEWNIRRLWDQF